MVLVEKVMRFLYAVSDKTNSERRDPMTTEDFIISLFCRVDDAMKGIPKHSQANLYPSEIVTLGILFALKGVGNRAFYRWLARDYRGLFPRLPERTRLFRLFATHQTWTDTFLVPPSLLSVIDCYGIELIHPVREGRSEAQIGKKGLSNHRWIVGGKLCFLLNHLGLVVDWDFDTANVHDTNFQPLIAQFEDQTVVFSDHGFFSKDGNPTNLKVCERYKNNERMIIETVLSMLTTICHFKKVMHRVWEAFEARLAFTMAAFNLLVQWHGLNPDPDGFVHLSIAEFSL
jgi:hypothetical protein